MMLHCLLTLPMFLPSPTIREHSSVLVVRDDLIPGGTKARIAPYLFGSAAEYVYASPVYGYTQVALAHAARRAGKRATIFCAKRNIRHPRTAEAAKAGASVREIPNGYMSVVRCRAKEYCAETGAYLIPFGFDSPQILAALTKVAASLPVKPTEVWSVAGSGVLTRALQAAWPDADFHVVQVGADPKAGRATIYKAPEK